MINTLKYLSYQLREKAESGFILMLLLVGLSACNHSGGIQTNRQRLEELRAAGELNKTALLVDSLKSVGAFSAMGKKEADSILEINRRISLDFRLTVDDVKDQLRQYFPDMKEDQLHSWERKKKLEMRLIDGEKRYFRNSVSNLFRLDDFAGLQKENRDGKVADSLKIFCLEHTRKILNSGRNSGENTLPVKMRLFYTIRVNADAVPAGETIRCWMPFPREGNTRQKSVKLIKSNPEQALISPANCLQRAIYLEKKAEANLETVFQIELEIETAGQYFDLDPNIILPYKTESELYKYYTSERLPQIAFTEKMKTLSDRIVSGETNPLKKVEKIYNWINDSIRWASALEYSTMPDIPAYVLENGHGDCGMQTLLFMTLARLQGIPAKWQSGWMLHPRNVNLHDWCEVYYEGVGWVPVDQSFGLQETTDEKLRNFYRSGIDSYRLIVNDEYGQELSPKKKFMRSEPIDFQRGELEWAGGNIYFDRWTWKMNVEYERGN